MIRKYVDSENYYTTNNCWQFSYHVENWILAQFQP